MKERPILFSGPMVTAILSGAKTQTRRIMKYENPYPECGDFDCWIWSDLVKLWAGGHAEAPEPLVWMECPYGKVGDRLWVRETFGTRADCPPAHVLQDRRRDLCAYRADNPEGVWCWKPSIHMPKWASRLTLEITEVRVQRLQEISRADIMAEGCPPERDGSDMLTGSWFVDLWESINGEDSWLDNPWVWCLSFRRVEEKQ